jgi:hypothetical protein
MGKSQPDKLVEVKPAENMYLRSTSPYYPLLPLRKGYLAGLWVLVLGYLANKLLQIPGHVDIVSGLLYYLPP